MTTLRYGSSGSEVAELQRLLNSTGLYSLNADGKYGTETENAVRQYQARNGLAIDGVTGANTWAKLTAGGTQTAATTPAPSGYTQSQGVLDAAANLAGVQAQKPEDYTSQYGDRIQELIDAALNRPAFEYDATQDPTYQQYSDMLLQGGKRAMMDAQGTAAQLSGGYGNSYAQTVGQQQYQNYMQQRAEMIPELRQLALDMYNTQGDEMRGNLAVLQGAESDAYGKYRDTVGDYNTQLAYATDTYNTEADRDYSKWLDLVGQNQWNQEYNLAVAQAAKKSSGGGSSKKAYSLLDDLQEQVDSGAMSEAQATGIMNSYYGIEDPEEEKKKAADYRTWVKGLTVEPD